MSFLKFLFNNKITDTILNKMISKKISSLGILIIIMGTYLGFNPDLIQQITFAIGSMSEAQQQDLLILLVWSVKHILYLWLIILLIKNIFVVSIQEETLFIIIVKKLLKLH